MNLYSILMQKTVRNLLLVLLVVINLFCQKQENVEQEISFWGMGAEGEILRKLIPSFQKNNPDIRVKVQMVPWTAAQEKLITAYASNNLPDGFQLGNTWVPQFVALNAIEELSTWLVSSEKIRKEEYFEGIWNTNIVYNQIYGIPWYIDTRVLFYRTDVLQKAGLDRPPKTWKELYNVSKKIKQLSADKDKYAIYLPTNEWASFVIFGLQANSELLRDNNCYGNFSGAEFKKSFEYLIQFHKENLSPMGVSQVTNVYQAFAEEFIVMYISGPWNVKEFKKWMKNDLADKWMTAPLPGPDEETPGLSLAGGSSLVLSKNSKNKKAVWRFFEYLSQPETQLEFYRLLGDLPAVKSVWNDSTFSNDPYMKAFFQQFSHVTATPKIPEWEQIAFSKIQQYAEFAARGTMSIDETLRELDADVDKILEKRRWLLSKKNKLTNKN